MEQNGGAIVDLTLRLTGVTRNYTITIDNEYSADYRLEWEDEFDTGRLDENVWSKIEPYESGNPDWRKNISTYDGCFDFRDGNIVLRGIANPGVSITGDSRSYLCGGIESWGKKSFKDGRIEIRAKTTSARGAWPALWMMPEDQSAGWPGCGEIDIFEHLNYDSFVYQTLHSNYTYNVSKESPLSHITKSVNVADYCHCEEQSDVAIRVPCNAQHCPSPKGTERERIATAFGLAMTARGKSGPEPPKCGGRIDAFCGTGRWPFPTGISRKQQKGRLSPSFF